MANVSSILVFSVDVQLGTITIALNGKIIISFTAENQIHSEAKCSNKPQ